MDGEIVNTLLTLFDKSVAEYLPCQVFSLTIHLLESLIHRNSTYRHRTVAKNPLASFVDIIACREVHQCVATPLATPYSLLYFLFDARSGRRVADVGIYLNQEVGTDNHRFRLWVLDIGRNHRPTLSNLFAYKGRSDMSLYAKFFAIHILTNGYILHFLCYDALLSKIHLSFAFLATINP